MIEVLLLSGFGFYSAGLVWAVATAVSAWMTLGSLGFVLICIHFMILFGVRLA